MNRRVPLSKAMRIVCVVIGVPSWVLLAGPFVWGWWASRRHCECGTPEGIAAAQERWRRERRDSARRRARRRSPFPTPPPPLSTPLPGIVTKERSVRA